MQLGKSARSLLPIRPAATIERAKSHSAAEWPMSADGILTLTCPHCAKTLRAMAEYAGGEVQCPHPDCLRPVPVPLPLEEPSEPLEPVLLETESAAAKSPEPNPRRKRPYEDENEQRTAIL